MEIPKINSRISQIIDYKSNGSRKKFAESIGIAQQTINRLFNLDTRTGKYPIATTDIIAAVTEMYVDLDARWLLTGRGEMIKKQIIYKPVEDAAVAIVNESKSEYYTNGLKPIPFISQKVAAGFGNDDFNIKEQDVKAYYVVPKFKHRQVDFMIEITGSSMYPKYNSGDVIACTIIRESSFIQWNKCHVIATIEQGLLVKRIKEGQDANHILAISDNKEYPPFEIPKDEITGIAIVTGVIRLE